MITFLTPGLRFFHQGQFQGATSGSRRTCVGSRRSPRTSRGAILRSAPRRVPPTDLREGQWQLLECRPAWDGNWTWDGFVVFTWQGPDNRRLLVAVNYAGNQGQCYVRLPFEDLGSSQWLLHDQLEAVAYERDGGDLQSRGLYLDAHPWQSSVFSLTRNA